MSSCGKREIIERTHSRVVDMTEVRTVAGETACIFRTLLLHIGYRVWCLVKAT